MSEPIVLNALALRPQGSGVQTYIRELLRELPGALPGIPLAALVQMDVAGELPRGIRPIIRPTSDGVRRAFQGVRAIEACRLSHALNITLPRSRGAPSVVTVHDLAYFDVPWAFGRARAVLAQLLIRSSIQRADRIIAVSAFTADRVRALFRREAVPIPLGCPTDLRPADAVAQTAVRVRYQLPPRFILHVGTIEPRKDIPTLAGACARAGLPLVLAGAAQSSATLPGRVHRLGYVPARDLAALYGIATVTAYTSRYEGFGLPPLEAMACGAPVVATDIPPLRETLSGVAELVRPGDVEGLAGLLTTLVQDDQRLGEMSQAGLKRASEYSWSSNARSTVGVYRVLGACP